MKSTKKRAPKRSAAEAEEARSPMPVLDLRNSIADALKARGWDRLYGEGNESCDHSEFENESRGEGLGLSIYVPDWRVEPAEPINSRDEMSERTRLVFDALFPLADRFDGAPLLWAERVKGDHMPDRFYWGDTYGETIDVMALRFCGLTLWVELYPFALADVVELDERLEAARDKLGLAPHFAQLTTERLRKHLAANCAAFAEAKHRLMLEESNIRCSERMIADIEARLKERGESAEAAE
jgi:hypothetical protein